MFTLHKNIKKSTTRNANVALIKMLQEEVEIQGLNSHALTRHDLNAIGISLGIRLGDGELERRTK